MSALGLATLGVQCSNKALGMASLGVFCEISEAAARRSFGGAPFVRRKKPKSFQHLLNFKGDTEVFDVEIPPIEVKEVSTSYQREIERFEQAVEILQVQEQQAEVEIDLLAAEAALELLIRREILIQDLLAAREFILDLQAQAEVLRLIKRRREDEEAILIALMMDDDNMNITVH